MAKQRILVIDDEMNPAGSSEPKYGRLSEADLALKLKSLLESQNLKVEFSQKGEDGLRRIKEDRQKTIKLVLLDIRFTKIQTKWQGPEVLRKIKEIRVNLPVVIITAVPVRKLPQKEDIFKELVQLGCSLYIEKSFFSRRGKEQLNFLNALIKGEKVVHILKCRKGCDSYNQATIDIDIVRREQNSEFSIMKNPIRLYIPMSTYIGMCVDHFPSSVHWTETTEKTENILSWCDIEFHKAVHKLNDAVMRSSGGRIPNFLERLGRVGCRINPSLLEYIESM